MKILDQKGFTLTDLLVTLGILAVISVLLGSIYISLGRTIRESRLRQDLIIEASRIAKRINDTIIPSVNIKSSKSLLGQPYLTGSTTVVLELLSIDETGEIIPGTFDYIALTLDSSDTSKLLRITDADDNSARDDRSEIIGSHFDDLTFTYRETDPTNSKDVSASFTISDITGDKTITHTLQTHATLRNK
ncbi:type II secretion system protein [Patescibacteria group bacterium]